VKVYVKKYIWHSECVSCGDFDSFLESLNQAKSYMDSHGFVDIEVYDSSCQGIYLRGGRLETDKEFDARVAEDIKKDADKLLEAEELERKQFEILKKKFGE
jgi:hypothetical protein